MTTFTAYWRNVQDRYETEIRQWVPEIFEDLSHTERDGVTRSLQAGRRIRGCLVCLICDALGGAREDAIPRAMAIECIHAASLMHDDVIDGDRTRRDLPAFWSVNGTRKAILLADIMFATAIRRMVDIGLEDARVVSETIAIMARGAYREYVVAREAPLQLIKKGEFAVLYEQLIHLKTGSLFGAAARLGALAARTSPELVRHATRFGEHLGRAYQIADDLVEVSKCARGEEPDLAQVGPALIRFGNPYREQVIDLLSGEISTLGADVYKTITESMNGEIAIATEQATRALETFPASRFNQLLLGMPNSVVQRAR